MSALMLLASCGGGGGSAGDTQLAYTISLRADRTQLPLNISHQPVGIGTYAPYSTTLYVEAREGGRLIQGGDEVFACNIVQGFDSGSLYYLDGDDEHEDDDGNPLAYRSVVLGANAGAATFHYHASATAGTARITCSITNPRDNQVSAASVDITVAGTPSGAEGRPASVNVQAEQPGYLGSLNNINSIRNNIAVQAILRDELNQQVANTTAPNLQVSIVGGTAAAMGARLLRGSQSGTVIQTTTDSGVANFSLASGLERGIILLRFVADRADNNVTNGIQDPISQLLAVPVVHAVAAEPLAVEEQEVTATCRQAVSQALTATGGVPPYLWEPLGALPAGLTMSPSGIVSGVPEPANGANTGTYSVAVRITDAEGDWVIRNITFNIEAGQCAPLVAGNASVSLTEGAAFNFALSATGGTPPYRWSAVGLPAGVSVNANGVLSGSIAAAGNYTGVAQVTDSEGVSVMVNVTFTVAKPKEE